LYFRPLQPATRESLRLAPTPATRSGHSAVNVSRGGLVFAREMRPFARRKSVRTGTVSGADHGVPKIAISRLSSRPSAVPRAMHDQPPGRGKPSSGKLPDGSSAGGATSEPSVQRTSAEPPGGAAARTPANAPDGSGLSRNVIGSPTSTGATSTPTENEPLRDGPARQSSPSPVPAPIETLTV
jgi:hypothetical protein